MSDLKTLQQRRAALRRRDAELRAQFIEAPPCRRWPIELALDEVGLELDSVDDAIAQIEDAEWDDGMLGREERLADIAYYHAGAL